MKKKKNKNYHTRLIVSCMVLMSCMIVIVAICIIFFQHNRKINDTEEKYHMMLEEVTNVYTDIWDKYSEILVPIYQEENIKDFHNFCKTIDSGYENSVVEKRFSRILSDIAKRDERIVGILFKRMTDGSMYYYGAGEEKFSRVSLDLGYIDEDVRFKGGLLGGRIQEMDLYFFAKEGEKIFGIQTRELSVINGGETQDFQFTILYDLDIFDEVIADYGISSEAYVLVTTSNGLILYDSRGNYSINQSSHYPNIDKVISSNNVIVEKSQSYLKNIKSIKGGTCFAFYMVPESVMKQFHIDTDVLMVLLIAILVDLMMFMIMLVIKRKIGTKFAQLENGIDQIGLSNLKYRIPILDEKESSEFSRIGEKFNRMCDDLNVMIEREYLQQVLAQKAAYKALKTTMNPHFLYNSLQTIYKMLADEGQMDVADTILLLSRIIDYQIHGDSVVTLWMELDSLQNYINFSSFRYEFDYSMDIDKNILDTNVPKNILQPVMENYLAHGYRGDKTDFISISGYLKDDLIHIVFCDNGKGIKDERLEKVALSLEKEMVDENDSESIGLLNIQKRLKVLFGEAGRVIIACNKPDAGVSVTLVLKKSLDLEEL